jgi:uncharacterized protein YjbJ (UPF0337 family)
VIWLVDEWRSDRVRSLLKTADSRRPGTTSRAIAVAKEENSAMSGTSDKIKGRVKEAVGVLTDDRDLKNEGKLDQATGKIKDVVEQMIDKAKNVADSRRRNSRKVS